jgi:hypothetical protein
MRQVERDKENEMTANVESMAWVGDRGLPWWVGGSQDSDDVMKHELAGLATGAEIREAAGLGWKVEKQPVFVKFGGKQIKIDDKYATVRSSDGKPLGVVGKAYQPVQNDELDEWGDALVDSGEAAYETAGSLRGGRTVFYSMELNHLEINVGGDKVDEAIKTFLLLTNTHDGTKSLEAVITCVRAVWPVDPEWSENRMDASLARGAMELYKTSENLDNIRGTKWGVLQAVAEFADHEAVFKGRGSSNAADVRANSILWGQAQWRKELALKALAKV